MARKKKESMRKEAAKGVGVEEAYDLTTPLWNRYYEAVRKRVRFPRSHRRAMNP